jgi:hypothetical protein
VIRAGRRAGATHTTRHEYFIGPVQRDVEVYREEMGNRAVLVLAFRALALAASASCSWVGMQTLPDAPMVGTAYACDESRARPVIDTALGVLALAAVTVVAIVTVDCTDGSSEPGCGTVAIGFFWVPVAVSFGLSARHGFKEAARCHAYHAGRLPLVALPAPQPLVDPAAVGTACERLPGVARGGRCPRGLVCRGDTCQP